MRPPNIVEFARILNEAEVDWVLIGGMAAIYHGVSTITNDFDIAVALESRQNLQLSQALKNLGAWQVRIESKPPDEFDPKTLNSPFIEFESNLGTFTY